MAALLEIWRIIWGRRLPTDATCLLFPLPRVEVKLLVPRAQPRWVESPAASLACSDGRIREAVTAIESALVLIKNATEYAHVKDRMIRRSRFHEEERLFGSAGPEESGV